MSKNSRSIKGATEYTNGILYHVQHCQGDVLGSKCNGDRSAALKIHHNKKWLFKISLGTKYDVYIFYRVRI